MLHPRRVLWARHQVKEHGAWMVFAARFIPGFRLPVVLISGMMHLHRTKLIIADATGLLLSVSIQLYIGWYFSKSIDRFLENRNTILFAVAGIGLFFIILYILYRYYRARSKVTTVNN